PLGERAEEAGKLLWPHHLLLIGAVDSIELEPVAMDRRRARMLDRPADDAGTFHFGSAFDDALAPKRIEERNEWKPKNGEIVAVDLLEQLDAKRLDLIGADRAKHLFAGSRH